jgi:hypothetical protein
MSSPHIVSSTLPEAGEFDGARAAGPQIEERRRSRRFPVHQELQYRLVDRQDDTFNGTGVTIDMSGAGIRFSVTTRIEIGRVVEVSVDWPARLDGICAMKVVVVGRVVRSADHWVAMSILRHEFRTRGSGLAVGATMPPRATSQALQGRAGRSSLSVLKPPGLHGFGRSRLRLGRFDEVKAEVSNRITQ